MLCDRILVIDHGKIVAAGTPDDLKRRVSGDAVLLRLADPTHVPDATRLAAALPDADEPGVDGDVVHVRVPNGASALPGLLRELDRAGVAAGRGRGPPADAGRRVPVPDRAVAAGRRDARRGRAGGCAMNETLVVFRRAMRLSLRNPTWVIIGLAQPILYLVLFGPLLKPLASQLGTGNAYRLFVPGILVQLGIFGALFVGFGLIAEYRAGVIETQRVTPAPRTALLMGRVVRDVVVLLVQAILLTLVALPLGLRAPVGGVLIGARRGRPARRRVLGRVVRGGADAEERGRAGPAAQRGRDAGAAAVRDPAADDAGAGLAGEAVGRQPAQARRGRGAGVLPRRLLRRHGVVGARRDRGPGAAGVLVRDADVPARVSLGAAAPSPA